MAEIGVDRKNPILKRSRTSTGISDLDILLEGGYTNSGLAMLIGPTGMAKNAFSFHFAKAAVKRGDLALFVNSDMSHKQLFEKSSSLGFDFKKSMNDGNVVFIDCYSSSVDNSLEKSEPIKNVVNLPGPSALNDLSLAIKEILQENKNRSVNVVFHSLSTFVLYNPANSIVKFIQLVGGRLKKANATSLMLIEEGMHEKTLLTSLEHMMDEVYELNEKGSELSIKSDNLPMEIPLRLGSAGIEL